MNEQNPTTAHPQGETPLQGWKEIAAYLERDPRTCQRWERTLGFPVRRYGGDNGSVYAYPSEIESWRASRPVKAEQAGNPSDDSELKKPPRPWAPAMATAAILAIAAAAVYFSPVLSPPSPLAEAAEDSLRTELVWAEARGVSPQGDVSPDGKFVTYVDWLDGGNLAVRELETGATRRLTDAADNGSHFALNSRISPDGKQVALTWFRTDSPDDAGTVLQLVPLAGGAEPVTVPSVSGNSSLSVQDWLPSGDGVAAILSQGDDSAQIVTVSIPDGEITQIRSIDWVDRRNGVELRVSPDGRRLAYSAPVSRDVPQKDIFVVSIDGSKEFPAVVHEAADIIVGWNQDGNHLLFNSDRDGGPGLWAQQIDESGPVGEPHVVVPNLNMGSAMGTTDTGSLHYPVRVNQRRMKTAELDFETGKLLAPPKNVTEQFVGRNSTASHSPNGRFLAYLSERGAIGRYTSEPESLVVRTLSTGAERVVPRNPADDRWGRLTWRSDNAGFWSVSMWQGRLTIFDLDAEDGALRPLALNPDAIRGPVRYVARPSENRLFYRYAEGPGLVNDDPALYSLDVTSGTSQRILPELPGTYSISPDGKLAAAIDGLRIRLFPLNGDEPKTLFETTAEERLGRWTVWAPDGNSVLVLKLDPQSGPWMWRLMIVKIDGSGAVPTELVYEPSSAGSRAVTIHPDGRQIVYAAGGSFFQVWALHNLPVNSPTGSAE